MIKHLSSTASEFFAVDASKVTPIPEEMSYEEGAMIEPLAVAVLISNSWSLATAKSTSAIPAKTATSTITLPFLACLCEQGNHYESNY